MTQKEQIQRFDNLVEKLRQTLSSKGKDYASEDVLSNFKESAERIGQKPYEQCLSMISQKVSRLSNLFKQDRKPNNESVQDSILDLIGYSFLLDAITEEQNKTNTLRRAGATVRGGDICLSTEEEIKKHFEEQEVNPLEELSKSLYSGALDAARQDFPEGYWLKEKPTKELTFEDFIVDEIFKQGGVAPQTLRKSPPEGAKVRAKDIEDFLDNIEEQVLLKIPTAGRIIIEHNKFKYLENFFGEIKEAVKNRLVMESRGLKRSRSTKELFDKVDLERTQAELMQRILLLSLVNKLTRSEKDKQELIKYYDELISVTEKLGEDTTELKQEREKLNGKR
jgi:hypothetical protein